MLYGQTLKEWMSDGFIIWEMICLQYFHNIFTISFKCKFVTGCYCWDKKVILVLGSNLN